MLPAYFLSPFVGRYEDILISFIVKRIADHLGHGISFGYLLVRQDRHAHHWQDDLRLEQLGMKITDDFIAALEQSTLSASNYADGLLELSQSVEMMMQSVSMTITERAQMATFFAGCRLWAQLPLW